MRLAPSLACATVLWLLPRGVLGQANEDDARGHFLQGRAAFESGRFDDALRHFEQSYELSGRAQLLFNIGISQERLHRDEEALDSLERYLEIAQSPAPEVHDRVAAIRARLRAAPMSRPTPAEAPRAERKPLFRQWWFWTAAGVVAAGVITGVVIASSGGSSGAIRGDIGGVIATLR